MSTTNNLLERTGHRLHGGMLIEQAMAMRSIALADLAGFKAEGLLGDTDIANLDTLLAQVHAQLEERTRNRTTANLHGTKKIGIFRDVKAGRRRLTNCMESILWGQPELSEYRQGTYHGENLGRLCADVARKLAIAKQYVEQLEPIGAGKAFQEKLEATLRTLETHGGQWEAAITALPEGTRKYNECKGRLFQLVRRIIRAGRSLHAKDPLAASKYTLAILSRRNKPRAPAGKTSSPAPEVEIGQSKAA